MRNKVAFCILSATLAFVLASNTIGAQNTNGGIDAVAISKNYYNSIVKVLLYDSAYAKISPAKAYLGRGSGFFVSEDGYIFTNRHVVNMCTGYCRYSTYNPDTKSQEERFDVYSPSILTDVSISKISYTGRASAIVQVYDNDAGSSYKLYYAKVVAIDTANFDGAILKIVSDLNGKPVDVKFHPVPLGNSDSTSQGQDLCLYGFPAQYNGTYDEMLRDLSTLTFGKHAGFDYFVNAQYGFIKTDAAINAGNSGGPVFGPGGKVIGLATAAFEKTNTGLIGGINAMYDLSALFPDLQKSLTDKGFIPPVHKPTFVSASRFKLIALPTKGRLNRANHSAKKDGIVNNPILIDYYVLYGVQNNGTYQIPTVSNPSALSSIGGNFNAEINNNIALDFRLSKPSLFKQKNNMIGMFFNLSASLIASNASALSSHLYIRDTVYHTNDFVSPYSTTSVLISACLGLSYTVAITNKISLGVYYGFGAITGHEKKVASITANFMGPGATYVQTGDIEYHNNTGISPSQVIGLMMRLRHFVLGAEYRFSSNENFYYYANGGFPASGNVNGTLTNRNSLSLFMGVTIRPRHKG